MGAGVGLGVGAGVGAGVGLGVGAGVGLGWGLLCLQQWWRGLQCQPFLHSASATGGRATAGQHAALVQGRHSMMQSDRRQASLPATIPSSTCDIMSSQACVHTRKTGIAAQHGRALQHPRPARHKKPNRAGGWRTRACLAVVLAVAASVSAACRPAHRTHHGSLWRAGQHSTHWAAHQAAQGRGAAVCEREQQGARRQCL